MSACLITISGTTGLLRLDYKIGVDSYTITTSIGTLYIEDTATDVTYTTLSGDLIASSGCLTITALPPNCYIIHWDNITLVDWKIDQLIVGSSTYSFSNVPFPNTASALITAVNNLNIDEVKITAYKIISNTFNNYLDSEYNYLFTILGTDSPVLKVSNLDSTSFMYLYSTVLESCIPPINYTSVDVCYNGSTITTTTTVS